MGPSTTREFHSKERVTIITESGERIGVGYVLVHGIGMGQRYWSALADELAKTGRVYALDLPGFGDAPEPAEPLDMRASGDLLAEIVAAEGIADPVLVGHSMGTQVVAEAAARHPEVSDCIVLIAPTVNAAERTVAMQSWRILQDLSHTPLTVLLIGFFYYLKTGPRWYIKKLRTMMQHQVELTLPNIAARTLVIRGQDDRVCPRNWVRRVTATIPNACMREVKGRGHETMITGAATVARLIAHHARVR